MPADSATVELLREQLAAVRRLDRELGGVVAYQEVLTKLDQVAGPFLYSLTNNLREHLAALLSELFCLAGWQALDLGKVTATWQHYSEARTAPCRYPCRPTWPLQKPEWALCS